MKIELKSTEQITEQVEVELRSIDRTCMHFS